MKKELIRIIIIGCIGIIPILGCMKEGTQKDMYDVEIIHISQIDKTQEQQSGFRDKDMVLFLGWIFPL